MPAGEDARAAEVYVSTRSLCEMDGWQARQYKGMIEQRCSNLFYSVNKRGAVCKMSDWQPGDGWRRVYDARFTYRALKPWRERETVWVRSGG